jgi:hypothetical protein
MSLLDHSPPGHSACEVPTTCQPPTTWGKEPWPATIRGIGTAGLSLTLGRRFERGSGLAIELPAEAGSTSTVLVRVKQVKAHEAGSWLLACDFISELSDEEVQYILHFDPRQQSPLSPGEGASGSSAKGATIRDVLFHAKVRPGEYLRWYVNRLDHCGEWPLPRGRSVALRVGVPGAELLKLKVKNCQLYGSYWIVVCKLEAIPSDEVLRAIACPFVA